MTRKVGVLLRTTEVAKLLGIHIEHLRRLIREGKVKAEKQGHFYYLSEEEFQRILKKHGKPKSPEVVQNERLKENIGVALYELELLRMKIKPAENSNIDRHFNNIKDLFGEDVP